MGKRQVIATQESCVIPYRLTHLGIEFCLVSEARVNRWEFPRLRAGGDMSPLALLDEAATSAGVMGHLETDDPIAEFVAARSGAPCRTTAYLMHVTKFDEVWPHEPGRRRLWCLAEEARARLRRKPWRRLIDVALQTLGARPREANGAQLNGNGHSTNGATANGAPRNGHPASDH
jgi:hypothetical protein